MKIIVFTFAGGNKYSFNDFFPPHSDITLLEYPGRGLRIKENKIDDIYTLVNDLLPQFKNEINHCDEYMIYGHSMGAVVGYLICQEIEKLNLKKPIRLIVSGSKSPKYTKEKILSNLEKEEFWTEVSKLGGLPDDFSMHPELQEFYIPILKADFKCCESYRYNQNSFKLNMPIDVFYGSDEDITQIEAESWKDETTGKAEIKELKGNHFFIFEHKNYFNEYFKNI